jgi:NhaP-type Na+/H+ or K+/H+ antiporter
MNELNIILTAIGGIVLVLGLVSDYFRRNWWTSDPLTALVLGIVLGPIVLNWVNPNQWGLSREHILEQTARLTMAIGLMGVALRLPQKYFLHHWRSLSILLGVVMPLMWAVSGLLVYFILKVPFWEGMMIGAAITPTDPIVSSSIVTGVVAEDNLPPRLRHLISAESGANDGLAYPFVLICILLLQKSSEETTGDALGSILYIMVEEFTFGGCSLNITSFTGTFTLISLNSCLKSIIRGFIYGLVWPHWRGGDFLCRVLSASYWDRRSLASLFIDGFCIHCGT